MPEDIQTNLPWIHRIIKAFNIPELYCPGFEADDVIGTIAHAAEAAGFDQVLMVTPDKDFAQLVTDRVRLLRYSRGKNPDTLMGPAEVCTHFGVNNPLQVIDLLGLWGDSVDNIPGIRGVGEKTAQKLIAQFGSVEQIVERADEIKNDRLRENVKAHGRDAIFSKQLATIRIDAPIAFDADGMLVREPDADMVRDIFEELEFRQLARRVLGAGNNMQQSQNGKGLVQKNGNALEPTLFDEVHPVVQKEQAHCEELTYTVLSSLKDSDVAVYFDGQTMYVATDADTVYCSTDADVIASFAATTLRMVLCYDLKALRYKLPTLTASDIFDAQLTHYLMDPELRHTPDFICSQQLSYSPSDAMSLTAALWQLYPVMNAQMRDMALNDLYHNMELPLVDVLYDMECTGVRIDTDALRVYAKQLAAELGDIEQHIYELAGIHFNIASPRQLGEVLYDRLKVTDKPPLTATKQYSTAEDVLQALASAHPVIPLILEYRSIAKLIGTYLDSFPKLISPVDHRLHTVYNQTITATGRLSSSNPNLQNIPIRTDRGREIRRAFVPADNEHLLLAADYSQIELRIIASLADDRHMLDAFAQGLDIHAATAAKIYHLPIEEVTKDQRRNAKSVNFGIVYGISAFGLSQQLGIPRKEAAALIDEYFNQYPDIAALIERSKQFARIHGYAQTLLGRRRYLPDISSRNPSARSFAERNAVNMPIQGTSADMIKLAMVNIHRQLESRRLRSKMILQVHDELVFDLYRPEEAEMRALVEHEMKTALPLPGIDIQVGIDVGDNWLAAH